MDGQLLAQLYLGWLITCIIGVFVYNNLDIKIKDYYICMKLLLAFGEGFLLSLMIPFVLLVGFSILSGVGKVILIAFGG